MLTGRGYISPGFGQAFKLLTSIEIRLSLLSLEDRNLFDNILS